MKFILNTGQSVDDIKSALERDNFMTADVAQTFGLIKQWKKILIHNIWMIY